MAYIFSDQQAKLTVLLGDSNTATDDPWPLATRKKELNRGELQFAKDARYITEYATGVIAGSQIAIPSDWLETFELIVNNFIIKSTREISINDWERYYNYAGQIPYYYFWRFSGTQYMKLLGSGINGQTYYLYYFKKPSTELAADSDVSIHDEEYREAPAYYAAYSLLEQLGKTQMADRYKMRYLEFVRDAQMYAEKNFLRKNYANPDVNIIGGTTTNDVEGQGFLLG